MECISTGSKPRSGGRRSSSSSSSHKGSPVASFVAGISSSVSAENWRIFLDGENNGNEPSEAHLAARGKPASDKSNQEAGYLNGIHINIFAELAGLQQGL